MSATLDIEGLGVRFGGLVALEDVRISVAPRSIHAVIGPNGAGKTTLLNLVTGLYRPTTGRVTLDGTVLTGLAPHRIAEHGGRADELLDLVGLAEEASTLAGDLALGQQRRLELARALAVGPRLLMLDEPAAGLRAAEAEGLSTILLRLREELGLTLVLIDHVMRVVMGVSDRISVLNYGRKLAEGTPEEVRNNPEVIAAYLGGAPHVA